MVMVDLSTCYGYYMNLTDGTTTSIHTILTQRKTPAPGRTAWDGAREKYQIGKCCDNVGTNQIHLAETCELKEDVQNLTGDSI